MLTDKQNQKSIKTKKMKQLIFAMALLMSAQLFAQDSKRTKTSFETNFRNSGYGALSTQYSKFNGQSALFTGAYGGWMIKHKLMIGLGGYWLATNHKGYGLNAETQEQNQYKMGYGGLMLEYAIFDNDRFHITANTLAGGGILKNGKGHGSIPDHGSNELKDIDATGFYVVQPSVHVEYAVTNWFRVGAGGGYRYITGSDQQGITDRKMSAPTADITFKFGGF